jgi:hypothetical protein
MRTALSMHVDILKRAILRAWNRAMMRAEGVGSVSIAGSNRPDC